MKNYASEQALKKIKNPDQSEYNILGFLSNTDIQNLSDGKGIISETDIEKSTKSLNELESKVEELFPFLDSGLFAPATNAHTTQQMHKANKQNDKKREEFVEIVKDLLNLVTKINEKITFATGDGAAGLAADASEMIKKLREGLAFLKKIEIGSMGLVKEDQKSLYKKLNPIMRVINGYLIDIDKNTKAIFNGYVATHKEDPHISFFTDKDIGRLVNGELIIIKDGFLPARNSLNELKSNVKNDPNSLENKVIENSPTLTKETFEENINFLETLLDEIESKVENESQDTTSETEGEINKDTNKIKEINDITIDSDEKLVTLNITDQEGHIIYSYILKFTRKGTGVTNASASGSSSSSNVSVDTNETGSDSDSDEDTNVSDSDSESDSNESVDTTGTKSASSSGSDSNVSEEEEEEEDEKMKKYFGGKRDSINDQYTIPKTVLTARMNEPFSIDDNSFIISN